MGTEYRVIRVQTNRLDFKFMELLAAERAVGVEEYLSFMVQEAMIVIASSVAGSPALPANIQKAALDILTRQKEYELDALEDMKNEVAGLKPPEGPATTG